ncbi:MAG TPA: medium chain dehydrogenase/reductase family protein [Labilithrix sp.]|nr:medium chain dehydrogenase/reductase family protein [Labilithrix sp.]
MRRVLIPSAGGYDRLRLVDEPDPVPGEGEELVRVEAIGVNYADCIVRMGLYASAKEYVGWPITPGFEVAGTTRDGTRVIALTRFGGYASHVVVPRRQLFPIPKGFSMAEASAFPAVSLTAYYALFELCRLRPGMSLLVHSAAGGVGSALVTLGKIAGCRVVGVVGTTGKVEHVRALGADHVVDKSTEDLWREAERHAPRGYDVVLDANGVETLRASFEHLAPTGRLVVYGFATMMSRGKDRPSWPKLAVDWLRTPRFDPLTMTNENKSVMAFNLSYLFDRPEILAESMAALMSWVEQGKLGAPRVQTFPMDRVADAHRALESGKTIGKLVLQP